MVLAPSVAGLFKWRQFEPEVILLGVGWYLRFSLSYRDVEELLNGRLSTSGGGCDNWNESDFQSKHTNNKAKPVWRIIRLTDSDRRPQPDSIIAQPSRAIEQRNTQFIVGSPRNSLATFI